MERVNTLGFAIIPDTQNLVRDAPELYGTMTSWIAQNAARLGVELVVHLGDVVDNGQIDEGQFRVASAAHQTILDAGIRLLVASGNHDYDDMEARSGLSMFNRYVGGEPLGRQRCFDGTFEPGRSENCYAVVDRRGARFVFVLIEYTPRPEVVSWADQVITRHRDCAAIVVTHSFIEGNGERTANGSPQRWDGEQMWQGSLKRRPNLLAVLCGHKVATQVAWRVDAGDAGNAVLTSFQNWQMVEAGGAGRIRIVRIQPSTGRVIMDVVNTSNGEYEFEPGYGVDVTLDAEAVGLRFPPVAQPSPGPTASSDVSATGRGQS